MKKKACQKKKLRMKPWTCVEQPKGSYPRFSFDVWFLNLNGKKTKHLIAAFTTKLATLQAENLAELYGWTFVEVIKRASLPKLKYMQ